MDKDTANRFYDESIKATNKRMSEGGFAYASYLPTDELMKDMGGRRLTQKEESDRREIHKKMTAKSHEMIGKKPTRKDVVIQ